VATLVERERGPGRYLSTALIYLAGYGSLLCAITLAAYVKEIRGGRGSLGQDDEDGKGGHAGMSGEPAAGRPEGQLPADYAAQIKADTRSERAITFKAAVPLAMVGLVVEIHRLARG